MKYSLVSRQKYKGLIPLAKMSKFVVKMILLISICHCIAYSQTRLAEDSQTILFQKMIHGDATALRDYATLLDEPQLRPKIEATLTDAFLPIDGDRLPFKRLASALDFFQVYYPLREIIRYDHSLAAFSFETTNSRAGLEYLSVSQIQAPHQNFQLATEYAYLGIQKLDTTSFQTGIGMLRTLPAQIQDTLVLRIYKRYISRRGNKPQKEIDACFLRTIAAQLATNDEIGACQTLCEIFNKQVLDLGLVKTLFREATMIEAQLPSVQAYSDSLSRMAKTCTKPNKLRIAGLENLTGSQASYFDLEEDFYGWMLIRTDASFWAQERILQILARCQHPRALAHLGTYVARLRWKNTQSAAITQIITRRLIPLIEKKSGTKIMLPNQNGALVNLSDESAWLLRYGIYWERHWQDYNWNARKGFFTHKSNTYTLEEEIAIHFQRLASPDDSIAQVSYDVLSVIDPSAVLSLLPEYTELMRAQNPSIPALKKNFLLATCILRDWGKDYGLQGQIDLKILAKLDSLNLALPIESRFLLEERIINGTSLADLNLIDLFMLSRQMNLEAAYSSSRILDKLYTHYWSQISTNNLLLRIYLKKSQVFRLVQTTGTVHEFLKKLDPNDQALAQKLKEIKATETDQDILLGIDQWTKLVNAQQDKNTSREIDAKELSIRQAAILAAKEPDYTEINALTLRPGFSIAKEKAWLRSLLKKWPRPEMLKQVILMEKLNTSEDLQYFETIFKKPEDLTDVWNWYQTENPAALIEWFRKKLDHLDQVKKGGLFFSFLRAEPIRNWLVQHADQIPNRQEILLAIEAWNQAQDYLSEYEEGQMQLIILFLDFAEQETVNKIAATCAIPDEGQKAFMQQTILAPINQEDLDKIKGLFTCLAHEYPDEPVLFKVMRNLGLPPVTIDAKGQPINFNSDINTLIINGLNQLGVPIYQPGTSALNYTKVVEILESELITPFVGGGGVRRDAYVYVTIKLLEKVHRTTLGFHPKLNENQTFFTYNATDRAKAWLQFLKKNALYPAKPSRALSWQ
jgi:hypothetical protein